MTEMNDEALTRDEAGPSRGAEIAALVAALGVGDSEVIGTLHAHGVRAGTVPLLEWLPALDVCWLDGADAAERHALRVQFAADERSSAEGLALLDRWLMARPAPALFEAARRALRARFALLDDDDRHEAIMRIVAMCEAAGRAGGANLGVGPLSPSELQRIHRLREALEHDG